MLSEINVKLAKPGLVVEQQVAYADTYCKRRVRPYFSPRAPLPLRVAPPGPMVFLLFRLFPRK